MKKPDELENRAANPHDPKGSEQVQADLVRVKGSKPDSDLAERLKAARAVLPPNTGENHCGHCFGQGREAACSVIENWQPEAQPE